MDALSATPRVMLWTSAALVALISLALAAAFTAGPPSKERSVAGTFALALIVVLLIHSGYLLAPFAAGSRWWPWCFWTTIPLAAVVVLVPVTMVFNVLRWTPPDGGSRLPGVLQQVGTLVVGGAIYAGPTIILWFTRPR